MFDQFKRMLGQFQRPAFVVVAWILGIFLALVGLAVVVKIAFALPCALIPFKDAVIKERVEACEGLFKILAVAVAGIWFLIRLAFQRQYDAAIKFTAIATPLPKATKVIALVAQLQNVTAVGAGIDSLTWAIIDSRKPKLVTWNTWRLPEGTPPILTRNAKWQLVTFVNTPHPGLYKLAAVCCVGLQPSDQAIHHESAFVVDAAGQIHVA